MSEVRLFVSIKKNYGSFRLDVNFEVQNEIMALLGASGCGKSLTLKCIAGIETPDEGRIVLNGRVLFDSAKKINLAPQVRKVGYLFQQYALFPNMTALQNIAAGLKGRGKKRTKDVLYQYISMLRLEGSEHKYPWQLSGGQQQRVALARILASEPDAILLDEPFSALDSYLRWQLEMELADTLSEFTGPALWVSHDKEEVYRNCSKVCVMDGGRTDPLIPTAELFQKPGTVSAARICGCKNFVKAERVAENSLYISDWQLTLQSAEAVDENVKFIGLHAHNIRFADDFDVNKIECRLARITEDVNCVILMLEPLGADGNNSLIRMELPKGSSERIEKWQLDGGLVRIFAENSGKVSVSVAPEHIMALS